VDGGPRLRIQKFLAAAGIASRRRAEDLVRAGRVTVNGEPATIGQKVGPGDDVRLDGRPVRPTTTKLYYLLYKPRGVVTTLRDPAGRPCLGDIVANLPGRVYPVGRLDRDSEGLLLLTNDGELTHALLHPSRHVAKTYRVTVAGRPRPDELDRMARGLDLPDLRTAPCEIEVVDREPDRTRLVVTVYEGQNRLVRRMFGAFGYDVLRLVRIAFAGLADPDLRPGELRPLSAAEVERLKRAGGLHEPEKG
jgi:23S rRNA pseudouridine2605 synthase